MNRRRLLIIGALVTLSAIAFLVPYSFDPLCRQPMSVRIVPCLLRNGGLTIARWLPLGFAILLALASAKPRR
jgi:hypothetical protein